MRSTKSHRSTQVGPAGCPAHDSLLARGLLAGSLAFLLVACGGGAGGGGKGGSGGGSGGSGGSGGTTGSGGSAKGGSGGTNAGGSGGATGSGGVTGSGGSAGSGGTAGSGGRGGSGGSGGVAGSGGSGGSGGTTGSGGRGGSGGTAGSGGAGGTSSSGGSGTGGTAGSGGAGGTAGSGGVAGSGGSGGAGGTAGSGGTTGAGGSGGGGSTATATDLKCTDPVYGAVSIPGAQVVSDFETDSLYQYVQDGRGQDALPWYAYAKGDENDEFNIMKTAGPLNPLNASNIFKVDTSVHGPCSTKGALHVKSPGPANTDDYVGWGIDFMARPLPDKKKLAYDGSKYTGVGFWAKCSTELQFAFEKVVDAAQDADISTSIVASPCKYSDSTCNQYGVKNTVFITKDWAYHKMFFSELLQDPNGKTFTDGVDPKKLIAFQIHVNPFSPRSGSPKVNPIDCHFDDVHFMTEAAPKPATETVTWSVDGTTIKRNGSAYKIRGIVRPSMEWDCAGFGITREDAQRIKAWHANTVRLAVKDTLWAGGSTGSATCDGGAYQRQVKRAINWLLEQKMDVILDLHYVGGSPQSAHTTFWDNISKDAFFKDGRIIFELYNEPTDGVDNLRTWMNSTIAKIRANGAKNLILVSGPDYTYDLSGYVTTPVTDSANATAYAVHPYIFKPDPNSWKTACAKLPVVATEFGDANVQEIGHTIAPDKCDAGIYSDYMSSFESMGMGWTAWAWIVDEWGCGFPQMIADYAGTPNAIGTPVKEKLLQLNP